MMDGGSVTLTPAILGPHPGLSILRIWQGIVEITLRIIITLCSLLVVALSATVISNVARNSPTSSNLDSQSKAAGLFVIIFVSLVMVTETLILILRFLNLGIINLQMKKFFIADIVISIMLVVVFVVSGLVQTVYAAKWKDAPSSCIVSRTYCRDQNWWKVTSAAAVGCFICAVLCGVLCVWSLLFIVKRWYYKILQYTSLP